MNNNHYIIPIFIPHRGCPHDCVFCNQKKITGLTTEVTNDEIIEKIDDYLKTMDKNSLKEIAFFGGSFTGLDLVTQSSFLKIAKSYKDKNIIDKIRLSTRPDYIDEEIVENLIKYDVDVIELGVQSMSNDVLIKSNRGHTHEDVYKAVNLIKNYDFELGLQMMIGLIGDNKEKSLNTAKEFVKLSADFVRIYPTLVVKDTYLEKLYIQGKYKPLTVEETVDYVTDILILFECNDIPVIRIGLQTTENISLNKDIVAGPFHPSLRQIIETQVYNMFLKSFFNNVNIKSNSIIIRANKKVLPLVSGYKAKNINMIKKMFSVKLVSSNIDLDEIIIVSKNKEYRLNKKDYICNNTKINRLTSKRGV